MPPWTASSAIDIDLDQPLSRRFGHVGPDLIGHAHRLLRAVIAEMPPAALRLARAIDARTGLRFHAESKALAEVAGVDWREVMLGNVSYDLALASIACSTVALPTPDGPVLARNMDWWPEHLLARASCLIRCTRGEKPAFALAGWPGSIGAVSALSANGFAVVLNAVLSGEKYSLAGYPVLLFLRRVLEEARDFDAALKMLRTRRLFTSGLFTLVGTRNEQRVCVERTPTRAFLRWARDGEPLVTTNSYVGFDDQGRDRADPPAEDRFCTECTRAAALFQLSRRLKGGLGADLRDGLLYALSDPAVIQQITAQHVLMQPATNRVELYVPTHLLAEDYVSDGDRPRMLS